MHTAKQCTSTAMHCCLHLDLHPCWNCPHKVPHDLCSFEVESRFLQQRCASIVALVAGSCKARPSEGLGNKVWQHVAAAATPAASSCKSAAVKSAVAYWDTCRCALWTAIATWYRYGTVLAVCICRPVTAHMLYFGVLVHARSCILVSAAMLLHMLLTGGQLTM